MNITSDITGSTPPTPPTSPATHTLPPRSGRVLHPKVSLSNNNLTPKTTDENALETQYVKPLQNILLETDRYMATNSGSLLFHRGGGGGDARLGFLRIREGLHCIGEVEIQPLDTTHTHTLPPVACNFLLFLLPSPAAFQSLLPRFWRAIRLGGEHHAHWDARFGPFRRECLDSMMRCF